MNHTLRKIAFLFAMIAAVAAQAVTITPSSNYVTRKVTCGAFDAVRTNTSIDIIYTVGPRSVEVYAPDNLIEYIKVEVKGSELTVGYTDNMNIKGKHKSCVRISAPAVKEFTTASSGDITIKSSIKLADATVKMTCLSAGDIDALNIDAKQVELVTSSAGDIEVKNIKAANVTMHTNSAGDIEADAVAVANDAALYANSAGDIEIKELVAGESVNAKANSAGNVEIDVINTAKADLQSNSSGNIEVKKIQATEVTGNTNSAGAVILVGNCSKAVLSSTSSGSVKAEGLKANDVRATVLSTGSVICQPLQSLYTRVRGMGKIKYVGNPEEMILDDPKGNGIIKI